MAQGTQTVLGGNAGTTQQTRRRAKRRNRLTARAGAATGIGSNVGVGNVGANINLQGMTAEQRKFYELGARHECERRGLPWQQGRQATR
jgi:hypothetical protein